MIVNRIRGALATTSHEHRAASAGSWGAGDVIPPPGMAAGPGLAGMSGVSESSALSIITVMACVGLLADVVSTLPIHSYIVNPDGTRKTVEPPPVVDDPYAELERHEWISQAMVSLLLRGNFYGLVIDRDDLGYPLQIMPVHPDNVQVRRDKRTNRRVYKMGGADQKLADVVHVPALMVPQSLVGLNPIQYARSGLSLAMAAEQFGGQFFNNGTHASGVIQVDEELEDDEVLALARNWAAAHQGVTNAHLPAVLTAGAKWQQISVNPDDAQFLETRKFQRSEVAMMFRVPPHKIGDVDKTTSWGSGIEQQELGWVIDGVAPWLYRLETMFTRISPGRQYSRFNLEGRLRGDTLQRFQAYRIAREGGWMNVDEIRNKEDDPPLPNGLGQDYLQPLNYAPLGSVPADPKAPPPPGQTGSDTP